MHQTEIALMTACLYHREGEVRPQLPPGGFAEDVGRNRRPHQDRDQGVCTMSVPPPEVAFPPIRIKQVLPLQTKYIAFAV
jgi:hypothetical protein